MPTQAVDGVFADTNLWVNVAVPTAPLHAQAVAALGRAGIGTQWTSRQVVREFLAVMSRGPGRGSGHDEIVGPFAPSRSAARLPRVAPLQCFLQVPKSSAWHPCRVRGRPEVGNHRGIELALW